MSAETIRKHLHRLKYHLIRPVLSINSPDPDYDTKVKRLEECQEQARKGELILLYEDEFDLNLLPGVTRCWTKVGKQRKVLTPGQNIKRYGFGAVNYLSGQLTYQISEHKNSVGFCQLIEQIVREYCPGEAYNGPKVVLVIDNYRIHFSKITQATLDKYADRLLLVPLPTYSPKLNVIELLWKFLRRKVTHNHLFPSITALIEAVDEFFRELLQKKETVLSIVGCLR